MSNGLIFGLIGEVLTFAVGAFNLILFIMIVIFFLALFGCCTQTSSRTVTTTTDGDKVFVTEKENSEYQGYLPPWSDNKSFTLKK